MTEPLHIFTVLNTEAWHPDPNRLFAYKPEHVVWMVRQLARFIRAAKPPVKCRFYCLSNVPVPEFDNVPYIVVLPLRHPEFKGWWSKLELFSPSTVEHYAPKNTYIDLDTVFPRNPLPILQHTPQSNNLLMLRNMSTPTNADGSPRAGSGVMGWRNHPLVTARLTHLYTKFAEDPQKHMDSHKVAHSWGDQGFISEHFSKPSSDSVPDSALGLEYYQDTFPNQIHSHYADLKGGPARPTSRIICMNGLPKPWDL